MVRIEDFKSGCYLEFKDHMIERFRKIRSGGDDPSLNDKYLKLIEIKSIGRKLHECTLWVEDDHYLFVLEGNIKLCHLERHGDFYNFFWVHLNNIERVISDPDEVALLDLIYG